MVTGRPLRSGGVWRIGCLRPLRSDAPVTGSFLSLCSVTDTIVTVADMEGGEECSTG